jgi:hypothetical protein
VDGEQREAVGEHVVHLARDPTPLGLARLVRGAVALLAHRPHELAPRAHEESPAERGAGDPQAGPELELQALRPAVEQRVREARDDREAGGDGQIATAGLDRRIEEGDERGGGQRDRDGRDADPDGAWMRSPPAQRDDRRDHGHDGHGAQPREDAAPTCPRGWRC